MKSWWLSLFPDLIRENLQWGVVGSAIQNKIFEVEILNPRDFSESRYGATDDRPFGGGDGMVQKAEPWALCLEKSGALDSEKLRLLLPTPAGRPWTAQRARQMAEEKANLVFFCGRYSGFDERLIQHFQIEEYSLGDYVVSGGEWPALILFDSIARYYPNVLGHEESALKDSFEGEGLLEAPLFTRPRVWRERETPEFLLSGHHSRVEQLQQAIALARTFLRRPDLLESPQKRALQTSLPLLQTLSLQELKTLGLDLEELASRIVRE